MSNLDQMLWERQNEQFTDAGEAQNNIFPEGAVSGSVEEPNLGKK